MREAVTFQFEGRQLVGTFHRPADHSLPSGRKNGSKRVAFLWLNSGYLPRSPVGDVISHVADRLAQDGMASFRFDLPGLGDSQGSLADDTQTYFSRVARGLNVTAANAVAREMCRRYDYDAVLMGGICGASITSIYAADAPDGDTVAGLVLLDPSFKLVHPFQAAPAEPGAAPPPPSLRRRLKTRIQELRLRVLGSGWGQALRNVWRRFKPVLSPLRKVAKSFRGEALPSDANQPLFNAFCRLARRRLPILALMAGDRALHAERFDYLDVVLRGSNSSVVRHYLADTNHSFSEAGGKVEVIQHVLHWLSTLPFIA